MPYITTDLTRFERKEFSQFGEDGVIEQIADDLGLTTGTFFEFGIGPTDGVSFDKPLEGNFVLLRNKGWAGVFLDGAPHLPSNVGVRREFITALNINLLYRKHGLPEDLDFMSIDVDGQEFWIWMALQPRPKVMIIEYNGGLPRESSVTTQFDVHHNWDGSIYQGASLLALDKLAKCKSYQLVWANGVNCIFIRDDLVSNPDCFSLEDIWRPFTPHFPDPKNRAWVEV